LHESGAVVGDDLKLAIAMNVASQRQRFASLATSQAMTFQKLRHNGDTHAKASPQKFLGNLGTRKVGPKNTVFGRDRPPCEDRRFAERPGRFLEKASNSFCGHPFFSRSMRRQKRIRMTQLIQAALNGPSMTIEELSDVGNAAMSEFEGLRCGKQTTLAFVQSGKGVTHHLLHRPGILGDHRGFLPKAKNPFPDRPDYHPNRAPKRPNATVNKFRFLSSFR
jgi:hypothetical protein